MSITINGKQYDEQGLSLVLKNTIIARQEILNCKARHKVELEKIDVLTDFYNKKIKKLVKEQEPKEIVVEKVE